MRIPSLSQIKPFVSGRALRILLSPGGLAHAHQSWMLLSGIETPSPGTGVSQRRLVEILSWYPNPRYLEIGIFSGATFMNVEAPVMVGVDPKPRFGLPQGDSLRQIFQGTSDAYFAESRGAEFDVFFVDGLHTYEQTWRDFLNSLAFAHEGSTWLIDDVVPADEFAALPDQKQAADMAIKANRAVNGWQGDVFRIVSALRRNLPEFQYATITGQGKEQLLAWLPSGTQMPLVRPHMWRHVVEEDYLTTFADGEVPGYFHPMSEEDALTAASERRVIF